MPLPRSMPPTVTRSRSVRARGPLVQEIDSADELDSDDFHVGFHVTSPTPSLGEMSPAMAVFVNPPKVRCDTDQWPGSPLADTDSDDEFDDEDYASVASYFEHVFSSDDENDLARISAPPVAGSRCSCVL